MKISVEPFAVLWKHITTNISLHMCVTETLRFYTNPGDFLLPHHSCDNHPIPSKFKSGQVDWSLWAPKRKIPFYRTIIIFSSHAMAIVSTQSHNTLSTLCIRAKSWHSSPSTKVSLVTIYARDVGTPLYSCTYFHLSDSNLTELWLCYF